ncbi:hypothetical protein PFISCL1PPCAC_23370, partial [Pristionchus fissidentatus]
IEEERKREKIREEEVRERIELVKQKIASFRSSAEQVEDMKRRIAIVESNIENLPVPPSSSDVMEETKGSESESESEVDPEVIRIRRPSPTVVVEEPRGDAGAPENDQNQPTPPNEQPVQAATQTEDERKATALVKGFPIFVGGLLEMVQNGVRDSESYAFLGSTDFLAKMTRLVVLNDERRKECAELVHDKMKESENLWCGHCDVMLFSPKHTMMHLIDEHSADAHEFPPPLVGLIHVIGAIMIDYLNTWGPEDGENQARGMTIQRGNGDSRPTTDFIHQMRPAIEPDQLQYNDEREIAEAWIERLKGEEGREHKAALLQHIGSSKARCDVCRLVYPDALSFFAHIRSYDHIGKAPNLDPLTFVVNLHPSNALPANESTEPLVVAVPTALDFQSILTLFLVGLHTMWAALLSRFR